MTDFSFFIKILNAETLLFWHSLYAYGIINRASLFHRIPNSATEKIGSIGRLGPKGIDSKHHNANVTVRDSDGTIISHSRIVSGNMTAEEKALGFPKNTLASHTEARAVTHIPLEEGQTMTITGQRPPCPSCKGYMNRACEQSGANIIYQWRQDGNTKRWDTKE